MKLETLLEVLDMEENDEIEIKRLESKSGRYVMSFEVIRKEKE